MGLATSPLTPPSQGGSGKAVPNLTKVENLPKGNFERKNMSQKNQPKPFCSLSLDLDNQWSYMKIHGDSGWEKFPSYFDIFIPHVLEILKDLNLKITFFVVGQDAALPKNSAYLKAIVENGHEVGNHSFHHESWLHLYSRNKIEQEIIMAEDYIFEVTGRKPIGFRGPGFSWSNDLLSVLSEHGYQYDASTLPTYLGPIARWYYFSKSNFSNAEKQERGELFGKFQNGMEPIKPFYWHVNGNGKLLEIPVTTMPILKIPFHLSYLMYLSQFSSGLMHSYLNTVILLCRLTRTEPSFLLHPLDLIGGDKVPELAFFPGMQIDSQKKVDLFYRIIKKLGQNFNLVSMNCYAKTLLSRDHIKIKKPKASNGRKN